MVIKLPIFTKYGFQIADFHQIWFSNCRFSLNMVFNLPIFSKFIADKYFVDIRFTELHPNRRKIVENRAKFHRRCCVKHVFHSTDCHSIHRRSTALHWPSSVSNFAHTVTEVWTVRAVIKLCLKVKYCCHSAGCRHTHAYCTAFCTELLYWTAWKSFKRLQVTDRQTDVVST